LLTKARQEFNSGKKEIKFLWTLATLHNCQWFVASFFFSRKRRREFLYNSNGWNCSQPSGCRETTKVRLNFQIPLNFESTFAFMRTVFLQYTQRLFLSRCRGELGFVQHKALVGEKNEIAIPRCSDW